MSKTIRQRLNRTKAICTLGFIIGFAGFAGPLVLRSEHMRQAPEFTLTAFAVAFLSIMMAFLLIRCPRCKTAWGQLAMSFGSPFTIGRNIVVCPFCRAEVDLPADDPGQPEC